MLGATAVLFVLLCYTQNETDVDRAKTHVGFVASLIGVLFLAAPLTMLVRFEFSNFY
jgi:formate-dependent nitrite reductase membrane component NrfD